MPAQIMASLVRAWADAWSSGPDGVDKFVALFTEDCRYEDATTKVLCQGTRQLAAFVQIVLTAVPDHKLELVHIAAEEHSAGAEWLITGTHIGDFPTLRASGEPMRFRGASILKRQGAKLHQVTDYWDFLSSGLVVPNAVTPDE